MMLLKKFMLIALCAVSFLVTSLTFIHFTRFLSDFSFVNSNSSLHLSFKEENAVLYAAKATVIDFALLSIFIIQHSSLLPLQDIISTAVQSPVLSRPLLNMFTSASLQLLMCLWKPIPQYGLWVVNTEEKSKQLAFVGIHVVSWLLIYVMMITMDITDLLGIKQVYYYATGRPTPHSSKSQQLKSLHYKMRHPSFLCFGLIFWTYPNMRLDRLLLASVWSLYMLLVWRPDSLDYNYVVEQQTAKNAIF